MFWKKGKPSASTDQPTHLSESEHLIDLDGSHQMTLTQPFGSREAVSPDSISIEYHLTISVTNESLSRRELSLLLEVLCYQAVNFKVNLTMFMAIYELYFRLLGQKRNSSDILDSNVRRSVTIAEILLDTLRNHAWSLDPKQGIEFPEQSREILKPHLMSKRTYGSRYRTWRPEKFLVVRIVPVDVLMNRSPGTQPYSSYCKGYGESHPSAHRKLTKPSAELDGDSSDPVLAEERKLFIRCTEPLHVLSEFLLIRYKQLKEQGK